MDLEGIESKLKFGYAFFDKKKKNHLWLIIAHSHSTWTIEKKF